ncbi:MAG TPA: GAF domain-containing sensor histidine kinase [Steroidobacteraceae bacterium]|jgi:signal transduction histidine kinase|nr:GAF domain-containing sensor histidine kinase [Steroidobacteraceae bacterium]
MNADVEQVSVLKEHLFPPSQCAEEWNQISDSLQRREGLLAASASASRLLLEAADVRGTVPEVLRLLGQAARVDRVTLMLPESQVDGDLLFCVVSEWVAEGVPQVPGAYSCPASQYPAVFAELRAGRSVCLSPDLAMDYAAVGLEGIGTKSKAIVPVFVAGEFSGVVAFDNTRQRRAIDSAELSALETAAGVIGAALHRERLVEDVRQAHERAAEERVAELAKANAVIRGNLERLAGEPNLHAFLGHMLLETARQFDAASGSIIASKESLREWRILAHVRNGQLETPQVPTNVPFAGSPLTELFGRSPQPAYINVEHTNWEIWPGDVEFHRREGHVSSLLYPLVFGAQNVGFFVLSFHRHAPEIQNSELLVALAQQATLAIQLTRLAHSAKDAAVLVERTRIGQEIHDGLAQAFTGILMQLGAAEEFPPCRRKNSELAGILTRIRDLAREGLAEARRSVMALRVDQIRPAGLEMALRQLADRSTVPGRVRCLFEGGDFSIGLRPEHEHEMLRIAQEAVSNAVRHARPNVVRISMTDESAHWTLRVTDDGIGMKSHAESSGEGFGLISMRQRALAIGGEWHLDSEPGLGTRVSVRLQKPNA